ncbi:histidine kinase [Neolewinella lacunae]|uniref:Histidine kinase n=1 Tax=Neolewinella lacunae TaxID=1517758 RepID=A0A923PEU4_9BACT|nr:histidine kinase [Neolewinella lacunae]MBC6992813.1 histidine kinase [Neolewinella lacunae]MDN3636098.1 histidine kinase [Neolewinella lacunae]
MTHSPRSATLREWLLLFLLYLGFAGFYMFSLYLSFTSQYADARPSWGIIYLDYPLKALFTVPVCYLTFRVFGHWRLDTKLLLNLVLMPFWIKGWQLTYYWIIDNWTEKNHLSGSGEWWDVYIPGLFYTLQFGIFHAWHYYHNFTRTEMARVENAQLALQSELNALKAQLNPHFLYNSLNAISASTGPGQEDTRRMIAQLSDLFRYQLVANRREYVALGEELDFVSDYLRLEQARFGERITFSILVAPDDPLRQALVPPLLLQPLVENAVRHGIAPSIIGGEVVIAASASGEALTLSVFNTGKPCDVAKTEHSAGYGLANTRRRLALLYGSSLSIYSDSAGTHCVFTIPLRYAPDRIIDRRRSPGPETAPGVLASVS